MISFAFFLFFIFWALLIHVLSQLGLFHFFVCTGPWYLYFALAGYICKLNLMISVSVLVQLDIFYMAELFPASFLTLSFLLVLVNTRQT